MMEGMIVYSAVGEWVYKGVDFLQFILSSPSASISNILLRYYQTPRFVNMQFSTSIVLAILAAVPAIQASPARTVTPFSKVATLNDEVEFKAPLEASDAVVPAPGDVPYAVASDTLARRSVSTPIAFMLHSSLTIDQ
jgi:hypothetical protein